MFERFIDTFKQGSEEGSIELFWFVFFQIVAKGRDQISLQVACNFLAAVPVIDAPDSGGVTFQSVVV